jgi:actin-related protein
MKIGWAGQNYPEATFPTLVGRPMLRYAEQLENIQIKVY